MSADLEQMEQENALFPWLADGSMEDPMEDPPASDPSGFQASLSAAEFGDKAELRAALLYAVGERYDAKEWKVHRKFIIEANLCPCCACSGERSQLGPWQPGNIEEWAGRECDDCGEFEVCGEQPEYDEGDFESGHSDADPGL